MRRILVDAARLRQCKKRGGQSLHVSLSEAASLTCEPTADVIKLDKALKELAQFDPRKAKMVELRFFGGLSVEEAAEVLEVSVDTVSRDWRLAKLWLLKELQSRGKDES